nr:DUF3224 domain-containing protein [Deinococcus hopiensis]
MRAQGTFTTKNFKPTTTTLVPMIETALPSSVSNMEKVYSGDVTGHSSTLFTAAFDLSSGIGSYIALEAFSGSLLNKNGAFNFIHSASTQGNNRTDEFFSIVFGSGTEDLKGIHGEGGMAIDGDGTHRIWFDFEL